MKTIVSNIKLDARWNIVPGLSVEKDSVSINVDEYFFKFENPQWSIVEWEEVVKNWNNLNESNDTSIEQKCLTFIKENVKTTSDAGKVLENAEKVYSYLYSNENLEANGLSSISEKYLKILKEVSILMAINKVSLDGCAQNVGPAWFFPICSQQVFDLSDKETLEIDEIYHGNFFMETRRVDALKAHIALGGRLVHGCQSSADMSGGVVVEYGTCISKFHTNLQTFKNEWMDEIKNWSKASVK